MKDLELDRLFDRFRRRGDVPALGRIFDATAEELLSVAMSLVHEPAEADDLLQETFLTAIERAGRYDAERRLVPWLLGILVHHARERRRLRGRTPDPSRLHARETSPPEEHVIGRELEQELERALAELTAREQAVLEAYLRHGKRAAEIASETGVSPGAVRMQIHRGLDRLRKALPAGLALGTAGGVLGAQDLASVRGAVLRAGEAAAKSVALGAGTPGAGKAGILGTKKLAVAAFLAVAAAGLWFWRGGADRSGAAPRQDVARAESPVRPAEELTLQPAPRAVAQPDAAGSGRTELPVRVDPDLAGLRGRLLTSAGKPAAGVSLVLVEADETFMASALAEVIDALPGPRLVVAEAATGPDGVFVLAGAAPRAIHALGIDLGGSRATLRLVEAKLSPGETAELGDVVLDATGTLSGAVVGPGGRPVVGARVRAGVIPEFATSIGLQHLRSGGAVSILMGEQERHTYELPSWAADLGALLPLATTRTDARGRFTLECASGRGLVALVDAPGCARVTSPRFDLEHAHDLGNLSLEAGASLRGRVVDAGGLPVAHAEVRAGPMATLFFGVTVLGPSQRCDAEGRFVVENLPGEFANVVVARRNALGSWAESREQNGEHVIQLGVPRDLVVEVRDAAGEPVLAPEFFIRARNATEWELGSMTPMQAVTPRPVENQAGRWRLGPLERGRYQVAARAPGLAQALATVTLQDDEAPVLDLVVAPLRGIDVLVRAAGTKTPLGGARVRVEERNFLLGCGSTDRDGRAHLRLPDDPARELQLHVEHARFAPLERALDASGPVVIELSGGARVVARLADPQLAEQRCLLVLFHLDEKDHEDGMPRLCAVPKEDSVVLECLEPGTWRWSLYVSVAGLDLLRLLDPMNEPRPLASGELELAEGQTSELALAAAEKPNVRPQREAELSGVVRSTTALGELSIKLVSIPPDKAKSQFTRSADGTFRFERVVPGRYYLRVGPWDEEASGTLAQKVVELGDGEQETIELEIEPATVLVWIRSEAGEPVADAKVQLALSERTQAGLAADASVKSGTDGSARLRIGIVGKYRALVSHPDEGIGKTMVEVVAGENEVEITLSRGVECAGTLRLDPGVVLASGQARLMVMPDGFGGSAADCPVQVVDGTAAFRVVGLPPGKYQGMLIGQGALLRCGSFELPASGSAALELRVTGTPVLPVPR